MSAFLGLDPRVVEVTGGINAFVRNSDGMLVQRIVYPPSDRIPNTHWENNGICAFTDEENRYYVCKSEHKKNLPVYTSPRPMRVAFSCAEFPVNSFSAHILGY